MAGRTIFYVDRRYTDADVRWLYYLMRSLHLDAVSRDSAVPGLNREDAYRQIGLYPPLPEQTAIAAHLDVATAARAISCADTAPASSLTSLPASWTCAPRQSGIAWKISNGKVYYWKHMQRYASNSTARKADNSERTEKGESDLRKHKKSSRTNTTMKTSHRTIRSSFALSVG